MNVHERGCTYLTGIRFHDIPENRHLMKATEYMAETKKRGRGDSNQPHRIFKLFGPSSFLLLFLSIGLVGAMPNLLKKCFFPSILVKE